MSDEQHSAGQINIWDELTAHAMQHGALLSAHIDLTYRCDLACIHCYLEERAKHELNTDELIAVLDDLAALGCLTIYYSGGDIFLRPDAVEILQATSDRRFLIEMTTHAGHITEEIADALAGMNLGEIGVSIYSSRPEVHDAITKLPGSLLKSLRAIRLLRQRGIAVKMKCPVFDGNAGAQLEIPLLAAKYDCNFTLEHEIRAAQNSSPGAFPQVGAASSCHDLRSLNLDLDMKAEIIRIKHPGYASIATLPVKSPKAATCNAGRTALYIDPEGKVFPCLEWEEACGDLREQPLSTIWKQSPVFARARLMHRSSFSGCTGCENFSFCSLCPGQSHRESGSATGVSVTSCLNATATRLAVEQNSFGCDLEDVLAQV